MFSALSWFCPFLSSITQQRQSGCWFILIILSVILLSNSTLFSFALQRFRRTFLPGCHCCFLGFSGPQENTPTQSSGLPGPDRLQPETEVRPGWLGRLQRWCRLSFHGVSALTKQQTRTQTEGYYLMLLLEIIV